MSKVEEQLDDLIQFYNLPSIEVKFDIMFSTGRTEYDNYKVGVSTMLNVISKGNLSPRGQKGFNPEIIMTKISSGVVDVFEFSMWAVRT